MKYTEFGEMFRILRLKHREVLADARDFLNVSSAFISAVECGKKPAPEGWLDKIVQHYGLNEEEARKLAESIEMSKQTIKIDVIGASAASKMAAIQFQRSFDQMDDETAEELISILRRNGK